MSRGPGPVERKIAQLLEDIEALTAKALTAGVYHGDVRALERITQSQYSSVRRALYRLQKREEVIGFPNVLGGRKAYYTNRETAFLMIDDMFKHRVFWVDERLREFHGVELLWRALASIEGYERPRQKTAYRGVPPFLLEELKKSEEEMKMWMADIASGKTKLPKFCALL